MKHLKKFNESSDYFTERELIDFGKKVLTEFKGNLEEFESWAINNLPEDGDSDGEDFGIESDEDENFEREFDDDEDF